MIGIREGSAINSLEPAIQAFLRQCRSESLAVFAGQGSKLDADPLPDELVRLGLVAAAKWPGPDAVQIFPQISDRLAGASGFSEPLAQCVSDKDAALRQARPRTTHLAVLVEDMRFMANPRLSPPPELTDAIDFLWIFLSDFLGPRAGSRVWRVHRGNPAWQLLWVRDSLTGSIAVSPTKT